MFSANTNTNTITPILPLPQAAEKDIRLDSLSDTRTTTDKDTSVAESDSSLVPPPQQSCTLDTLVTRVQLLTKEHGMQHPSVGITWHGIASALYRRSEFDLSLEALDQAIKCSKSQPATWAAAYSQMAAIYWNHFPENRIEMAIHCWTKCLQVQPEDRQVLQSLGLAYMSTQKYTTAKEFLLQAYALSTESLNMAESLNALGRVCFLEQDFLQALEYHEEAFMQSIGTVKALDSLRYIATTYLAMGDDDAALFGFRALWNMQSKILLDDDTLSDKSTLRRDAGGTLQNLGDLLSKQANAAAQALDTYQQARFFYLASGLSMKDVELEKLSFAMESLQRPRQ